MGKYFYHGIGTSFMRLGLKCERIEYIELMLQIISSGGLKCRRLQGITSNYGFNGIDFISVCSKVDEREYDKYPISAYYNYIIDNFCFIISDEIPAIKTRYNPVNNDLVLKVIMDIMSDTPEERFSDMFDEWQVKDEIGLNQIVGIGIPFDHIALVRESNPQFEEKLNYLIHVANELNWIIVNTCDINQLDYLENKKLNIYKK